MIGKASPSICAILTACLIGMAAVGAAFAATADELRVQSERAEAMALEIRADLVKQREGLFAAEAVAIQAAEHERELSRRLANGRERSARLAEGLDAAEARLVVERRRLVRAQRVLAERLVAIYKTGPAETVNVAVAAEGYGDLIVRAAYLRRIENADVLLAERVMQVQGRVEERLTELGQRKQAADRHRADLAEAHSQIAAVEATAADRTRALGAATAEHESALAGLKSKIETWAGQIERAAEREAARRRADSGSSIAEVERWLGGPYSIPAAIVMCESGGNYQALNPSSGAGGAYQIIPSTWAAYGGEGLAHRASKAEQDRIAALIWADAGPGAWVCKG